MWAHAYHARRQPSFGASGWLSVSLTAMHLRSALRSLARRVVLRNRPDIVATGSDKEVVQCWWFAWPSRWNEGGSIPDPKPCEVGLLRPHVSEYRRRLSDISWMRLACQRIAVRANKEDGVDGRYFPRRFDCQRMKTKVDVLNCSLYVDLN